MNNFKVLISDKMSKEAVDLFVSKGIEVTYKPEITPKELIKEISNYDGLAIRSNTIVDKELLNKASKLKVIGRAGVGIDNIDLQQSTACGVVIMNTPDGNSITTAEHTIAMIMSLARKIPAADASTRLGKWEKSKFIGTEVTGKKLGLIGCGNIGSIVADRAKGLRMKVAAFDPFLTNEKSKSLGIEKVEINELIETSDIISIHTPLTDSTRHIINKDNIKKFKHGAWLINCARGGLIDESGLRDALDEGYVGGAAIDVFEKEPAKNNILFGAPNLIVTPHLGASTKEAQEKVAIQVAEQIVNFLKYGETVNALNMVAVSSEEAPILVPYIKLAELLGKFLGQVNKGSENINSLKIEFDGTASSLNEEAIVTSSLVGLLSGFLDSINMVNASNIASQRGLTISSIKHNRSCDYQSLLRLTVEHEKGIRTIAGTLIGGTMPRITEVQGISVEANFADKMIYVRNYDQPGFIGDIGSMLGKNNVNIASFHLGRRENSGEAIALVAIDQPIDNLLMSKLIKINNVVRADYLTFNI